MSIFAARLEKGSEVRIIAPSRNLNIISQSTIIHTIKTLESLDLKVTERMSQN